MEPDFDIENLNFPIRIFAGSLIFEVAHLLLHFALDLGNVLLLVILFDLLLMLLALLFVVIFVEPGDAPAILPEAGTLNAVDVPVYALTMLLPVLPLTSILPAILPVVDAEAMFLITEVLALVLTAVGPGEVALAAHVTF